MTLQFDPVELEAQRFMKRLDSLRRNTLFGAPLIETFRASLDERSRAALAAAVQRIVEVKERGGRVMVVTGSGPNIHEGVTTLIAELIRVGLIDAVSTSSAVVSHEMGGALDLYCSYVSFIKLLTRQDEICYSKDNRINISSCHPV